MNVEDMGLEAAMTLEDSLCGELYHMGQHMTGSRYAQVRADLEEVRERITELEA